MIFYMTFRRSEEIRNISEVMADRYILFCFILLDEIKQNKGSKRRKSAIIKTEYRGDRG